jgi:hypothetical protein
VLKRCLDHKIIKIFYESWLNSAYTCQIFTDLTELNFILDLLRIETASGIIFWIVVDAGDIGERGRRG